MNKGMKIVFFGSSLVSAYWNGAATYYRGIIKALASRGHEITFYEPDIYDRQQNRDMPDPEWANVVVYSAEDLDEVLHTVERAADGVDMLVKTSGVGAWDRELEKAVIEFARPDTLKVFWDVDAPATLDRVHADGTDPFLPLIPQFDMVLTYGGGNPVVDAYKELGASQCVPIYNAVDPFTHHPTAYSDKFGGDLALLANRLPDREARIEEFFLRPAAECPGRRFILGGSGWDGKLLSPNVRWIGHVKTHDHNLFNSSPLAVLNVNRESMARYGFSPPTRVFEAAGAAACLITDEWEGIEMFLEPDREVLVARDGEHVSAIVNSLDSDTAREIGMAAYKRVIAEHTYEHRAKQLEELLNVRSRNVRIFVPRQKPMARPKVPASAARGLF
jgi:spore maturation protein CgeB